MESGKTPRMEELESGQQEMQEKIAQMTKMVKGKGITDDPGEPTSWKGGIDPSVVPNSNDLYEQERLRKNLSGQSKHVDM